MVNTEELLEEAKRRYPVGTKYYCANGNGKCTVKKDVLWKFFMGDTSIIDAFGHYFVYYKGNWAEIAGLPKEVNKELIIEIW